MIYMLIVVGFIVGFFLGAGCYAMGLVKFLPNHRMQDELTRTKRELAASKRVLDEVFKTSSELFSELDKSYHAYAKFMNDAASKLSSTDGSLFTPQNELEVEDSLKKMLGGKHLEDFNAEAGASDVDKDVINDVEEKSAETEVSDNSKDALNENAETGSGLVDAKETINVVKRAEPAETEEKI